MVLDDGYAWNGCVYRSLSQVAKAITGTNWNGHRFFGLKAVRRRSQGRAGWMHVDDRQPLPAPGGDQRGEVRLAGLVARAFHRFLSADDDQRRVRREAQGQARRGASAQ